LPELTAVSETEVDVVIRRGKVRTSLPEIVGAGSSFHITAEKAYLFWDQVGAFVVRGGREIVVDPLPEVEDRIIRLPLLGVVLAVLLFQRGVPVLHSSAISVNGTAVAFLGVKGAGKSTIAAALYARGHQLIADDLVALDVESPRLPLALPGFGQFKLWPEPAAVALGEDGEALPRLYALSEKRVRMVDSRLVQRPVPLRQIYVLGRSPSPHIEPLRPQEAMIQLLANLYAARLGQQLLQTTGARHFLQCADLARVIPAYRLGWPQSLGALPVTVQLVEEHLARDTPDAPA
jgi:hypothetical protein